MGRSCENAVVEQLKELQKKSWELAHRDGQVAEDDFFSAEQNARLVKNAEEYYRAMFGGRVNTWNLRDRHMFESLQALAAHLERRYGKAKIVVWAHNSHLGNARATDRAIYGEWNLGQLVRESSSSAVLVGFTTYTGTVTAANDWGEPHETKRVRPGMPGSYEALSHDVGIPQFLVTFAGDERLARELRKDRLERAIGVIYRPHTERDEPLLRSAHRGPVRHRDPHRRDARARTAAACGRGADGGRAGDVSDRGVRKRDCSRNAKS